MSRHGRRAPRPTWLGWPLAGGVIAAVVIAAAAVGVVQYRSSGAVAPRSAPRAADSARPPAPPGGSAAPEPGNSAAPQPATSPTSTAAQSGGGPARFATVPAGGALPSGTQCATWVRARPYPETKKANTTANHTTGHRIGGGLFTGGHPRANTTIAPRIDGQFTGTTREILRWAACKWGVDEDIVFAQAAVESWWVQGTLGDWTADASRCAPGRGLGVDGRAGQCPESFGILQNRYPYEKPTWPGIATSTAMNADVAYAIWRACLEGYETWLNDVEQGRRYGPGDAWGCVGRWFSGRWQVPAGDQYVTKVRDHLDRRVWESRDFQQP